MGKVLRWIDEQTEIVTLLHRFMREPLPKSTGFPHVFGSLAMFLFVVQVLTGGFLLVYYSPSPDHAYTTVQYITNKVAFGDVVRGLHHWAATGMMVAVGLHMLQVFFWGAYKKPRQFIWVLGTLLLLLTFAFGFTGYLLPWDQKAYWATVVGTNIAGTVPFAGEWMRDVLRGGETVGALTLTRFFFIHIYLLPPIMVGLIVFHVFQVRRRGLTPSWVRVSEEKGSPQAKPTQYFWPQQAFRDLVVAVVALAILLYVAARIGAPIEPIANPSDTAYVPRPEWYYLWLFELLKYFPGELEFVGGVLLPTLGVIGLLLLPFIDRNPERRPLRRPLATTFCIGSLFGMTYLGTNAILTTVHPDPLTPLAAIGEKLFLDQRCHTCHGVNGGGGNAGPDLGQANLKDRERVLAVLVNPSQFNSRSVMPPSLLGRKDLEAITEYIVTIGPLSKMPEQPSIGPRKPPSHFAEAWYLEHKFEVRKDPTQCGECHKQDFCQSCHFNRRPDSHLTQWMKFHFGTAREKPAYCAVCHKEQFCSECHDTYYHTPDWLQKKHMVAAKKGDELCSKCHKSDFCTGCHGGAKPLSHDAGWVHQHGKTLVSSKNNCATCHETRTFCSSCHEGARPTSHGPQWIAQHGNQAKPASKACMSCHREQSCSSCHGIQMPHPSDWVDNHKPFAAFGRGSICMKCHEPKKDCADCHELEPERPPTTRNP